MQLKNINLPFREEWYANAINESTPWKIQVALDRIALMPESQQEDLKLMLAYGIYLAAPTENGTATISRTRNGQYRVKFKGDNGKNLSPQDTLHNRQDLLDTLAKYFPGFKVIEK